MNSRAGDGVQQTSSGFRWTPRTVYRVLEETAERYPGVVAMHQPVRSGSTLTYRTYTWAEYLEGAREIACGLRSLGIGKGDIVALHSETRAEFYLADIGTMANGSIAAALYTSLPPADHVATIRTAAPKAIFVEDPASLRALRDAGIESPNWILLTETADGAITLEELRRHGRETLAGFDTIQAEVTADDYAILYLTSGATGEPKMGLVTHAAVVANLDMGPQVLPLGPEDSTVVFLPSAHIAQRIVIELLPIRCAMPVYFSEGLSKLPAELRNIKPTFVLAPPRVWERIYASISAEIRKKPAAVRKLFYGALGLGLRASKLRVAGKPMPVWMRRALHAADALIFRKIRARLGGRIRCAASGAAPLGRELAQFYEAIGLPLIEGYGLTEGGVVSLNPVGDPRPGSIGKTLPGVEVRLADDGELLVRSPCLFSGYYKDEKATAAVLKDGWLYTGDIAEIDAAGFITITGRKKELIVSSNGKKIYPARIEGLFKTEPLVNQVVLIGDRQPYVTALFTINSAAEEPSKAPDIQQQIGQAVKRINRQLAPFEQIKRFRILDRDFSIERGELTPTMKVRRTQVLHNYRHEVSELYLGKEEMA